MGLTVDSSQLTFLPTSKSRDTKTRTNIKKRPAPIVNGGGDSFWKWKDFQLWRARDLDLGSGHTAYHRASLINLYLQAKFHWNWRTVFWMDRRTYVPTYGQTDKHFRPALLGRLRSSISQSSKTAKFKNYYYCYFPSWVVDSVFYPPKKWVPVDGRWCCAAGKATAGDYKSSTRR